MCPAEPLTGVVFSSSHFSIQKNRLAHFLPDSTQIRWLAGSDKILDVGLVASQETVIDAFKRATSLGIIIVVCDQSTYPAMIIIHTDTRSQLTYMDCFDL